MLEVSPATRALARRVLLHEAGGCVEPVALAEAAERADAQLRGRLVDLIGLTGYTCPGSRRHSTKKQRG